MKRADTTAHDSMLAAMVGKAEATRHADFHVEAQRRYAEFLETGESIPWGEFRRWLMDRIHGKATALPIARKLSNSVPLYRCR